MGGTQTLLSEAGGAGALLPSSLSSPKAPVCFQERAAGGAPGSPEQKPAAEHGVGGQGVWPAPYSQFATGCLTGCQNTPSLVPEAREVWQVLHLL